MAILLVEAQGLILVQSLSLAELSLFQPPINFLCEILIELISQSH